jgi:hypothetical protein
VLAHPNPEFSFRLRGTKKFLECELEKRHEGNEAWKGSELERKERTGSGVEVISHDTSIALEDTDVD